MIEKLASREGESTIKILEQKRLALPKMDKAELDGVLFGGEESVGYRHSIALGELDSFSQLPRTSALLSSRPLRPKRKNRKNAPNPMKTANPGCDSYTENRTNVSEMMNSNYSKRALAGLAATEDVKNVRLRSASRNRDEEMTPYRHPLLVKFKGRQRVYVRMVPACIESLNHEDAFVLVTAQDQG